MTERTITPAAGQPQSTVYDYNNANQLIEVGSSELDWDQNGNLLEDQDGQAFDYDRRSLTREIDPDGGPAIDLGYSDDTQRERITKAETTYTDDLLGLAVEDPGSPASPTFYVRHPDTGEVLGMRNSAGSFYFLSDLLGSVRAITDSQGELLRRYRYEPYGQASGQLDPPGAPQAPQNPIRFQNQYLDQETGLYKMGMRYMDPQVGRWTQRDPLNLAADPRQGNRYGFAGGDPVNNSDPSGMLIDTGVSTLRVMSNIAHSGLIGATAAKGIPACYGAAAAAGPVGWAAGGAACSVYTLGVAATVAYGVLDTADATFDIDFLIW